MSLWNKTDALASIPKYLPIGRVLTVRVIDGGTGYVDGEAVAVTIGAPAAGGVQAVGTAVVEGGIVQSITLSNTGSNYTAEPTITIATGTGLDVVAVVEPVIYDPTKIVFVDRAEASLEVNKAKGIKGPGWWYITSREDSGGNTRYSTENFVAISASGSAVADTGDRADDALVPDSEIAILIAEHPESQSLTLGEVDAITVGAGGTGYTTADVEISAPAEGGVQATATATIEGGVITAIALVEAGSGYTEAPTVTITGDGTGATATAALVAAEVTFTVTASVTPSGTAAYQWQVSSATETRYADIDGETSASLTVSGITADDNGNKYRVKISATGAAVKNSAVATLTVA